MLIKTKAQHRQLGAMIAENKLTLTMSPAAGALAAGVVGTPYNQSVSASNAVGSTNFAVTAGALPAGIALNSATGALTGTPTAAAANSFTIRATDAYGNTGSAAYTLATTV